MASANGHDVASNGNCPPPDTYTPKNIMITGACGFIASHVAIRLAKRYPQYKIVVLDKLDYCASIRNLESVIDQPNVKLVKGDIQSMDLLSFVLQAEEIDTIMHFAAQTHVDNSFGNSFSFTMNNIYGTHVMLEAARMTGNIKRFINVSTDEVYGETSLGKEHGLMEHSTLEPTNPYSAAKAGAEMLCKSYMTSYKLPIIITRGNNVYGPHQFPEKMIPKFTLLAARGADLPIHGDGGAVRSYLFVEDVAEAFDAVLHKGETGEVYNIGTEKERTVKEVAMDIAAYFKLPSSKVVHVKDRAFNDRRYYIGSSKLGSLGWQERTSWEEGLRRTIDWYMQTKCDNYWQGDLESALKAHPVLLGTNVNPVNPLAVK
jgi:UDP-glucose 4,6-dehydratase